MEEPRLGHRTPDSIYGIFAAASGLSKPHSSATSEILMPEVQKCWNETIGIGSLGELIKRL